MHRFSGRRFAALVIIAIAWCSSGRAAEPPMPPAPVPAAEDQPTSSLKTERFDRDPGWEGFNNRVEPERVPNITQDFGYSPTSFASTAPGETGGGVTRSTRPAYYGDKTAKTLNDALGASGSFAVTTSQPGAGVFFGWFQSQQPGGSGRPIGSLGLDFDFEQSGGRLAVRLITRGNKSCGTFITPYLPGKYRPTPIKNDGTRYHWRLDYDPEAAGGNGRFTFMLRSRQHPAPPLDPNLSDAAQHEARSRFPYTTTFAVDVPPALREEGATFDRFGMMNMMKAGGTATMFFDDLTYDRKTEDFSTDPGWIGSGNRATYQDREQVGAHDFGFSAQTKFAGGSAGEIGGSLWRSGNFGYYADRVGPLSLDDRLEARGKVLLHVGAPDSDVFLGWFSSESKEKPPAESGHFLGVHVGGPTRIGHFFHPAFATASGTRGMAQAGPVLVPGKVFDWSLSYDPAANDGNGEIRVTLGKEAVTLPMRPGLKAQGAKLDRFGLFNSTAGGQLLKIYLDDLTYTAARGGR